GRAAAGRGICPGAAANGVEGCGPERRQRRYGARHRAHAARRANRDACVRHWQRSACQRVGTCGARARGARRASAVQPSGAEACSWWLRVAADRGPRAGHPGRNPRVAQTGEPRRGRLLRPAGGPSVSTETVVTRYATPDELAAVEAERAAIATA